VVFQANMGLAEDSPLSCYLSSLQDAFLPLSPSLAGGVGVYTFPSMDLRGEDASKNKAHLFYLGLVHTEVAEVQTL